MHKGEELVHENRQGITSWSETHTTEDKGWERAAGTQNPDSKTPHGVIYSHNDPEVGDGQKVLEMVTRCSKIIVSRNDGKVDKQTLFRGDDLRRRRDRIQTGPG